MGKIPQGILGAVSGTVGNVVGASWKGIAYIRSKAASVANPRTEGQVNQRNKFAAVGKFLKAVQSYVRIGFKGYANKRTPMNAAMSYNIHHAVTGIAPDWEVDYPNALVSRGSLTGAAGANVLGDGLDLNLTWSNNSDEGNARPDDIPMILVYAQGTEQAVSIMEASIRRDSGEYELTLGGAFAGATLHVYMAYRSADGKHVSNSTYVGTVQS